MPLLIPATDRAGIAAAFADPQRLVVVSFCAAWCETCNEFRAGYERLATARPHAAFVWIDIEDDAEWAGDIDVENFPTLAVYRGATPLHFGVSPPHENVVGRLIDALAANPVERKVGEAVEGLPQRFA
ncbi:MAG TPA: thioredoxin family protein [Casimicrobiaceae bacterium]|nr:thioredoxin family protein [Casimicrobiaceae bacterium]